jgi:hypothetical protein
VWDMIRGGFLGQRRRQKKKQIPRTASRAPENQGPSESARDSARDDSVWDMVQGRRDDSVWEMIRSGFPPPWSSHTANVVIAAVHEAVIAR